MTVRHGKLVEDSLLTCAQYLTAACREDSKEHRATTFHRLMLLGKMRTSVRWVSEQETVGVIQPKELCTQTRERVMEVLRTKHPDARPPTVSSLDTYPDRSPELVPKDITNNVVTEVARRLSGGSGLGGTDSVILHHQLLSFIVLSRYLRLIVEDFAE